MDANTMNKITKLDKKLPEIKKEYAKVCSDPVLSCSRIIRNTYKEINLCEYDIFEELSKKNKLLKTNGLETIEDILCAHVYALQTIFEKAAHKLINAQTPETLQAWGMIALKAQNQSRQTLATLIDIKNPKQTAFIKQQNNAINQQVNNSEPENNLKNFAGKNGNELFVETLNETQLDTITKVAPIQTDKKLDALEICRSKNTRRKRNQQNERL
ncbi:MAG: hypothetical protein ABI597_08345 [Gammaproteobacteria bacterium]